MCFELDINLKIEMIFTGSLVDKISKISGTFQLQNYLLFPHKVQAGKEYINWKLLWR